MAVARCQGNTRSVPTSEQITATSAAPRRSLPSAATAAVDQLDYRRAISHFATGVAVVTTADDEDRIHGMTASAVTSVSLSPVLLAVCIANDLPSHGAVRASGRFNVNLLRADQQHLAHQFARPAADKFAGVALVPGRRVPLLADALAHFECALHQEVAAGDHSVFIGQVESCSTNGAAGAHPLLYFRSAFHELAAPASGC